MIYPLLTVALCMQAVEMRLGQAAMIAAAAAASTVASTPLPTLSSGHSVDRTAGLIKIYSLLLISISLPAVEACVPVRPGEDMPCPSVPFAGMVDGYNTKDIQPKQREDGAEVYACGTDELMLSVENRAGTPLPEKNAKILCRPGSGIWVTSGNDLAVGSKTFACAACECTEASLTVGATGLCDHSTYFCVPPKYINKCMAACPIGSETIYWDASGTVKTMSKELTCANKEWILAGTKEVTCRILKSTQFGMEVPPGVTPCKPDILPALTDGCGITAECAHSNLIYVPYKNGYAALCRKGLLFSDGVLAGRDSLFCEADGKWTGGSTKANCDVQVNPVGECYAKMPKIPRDMPKVECTFGVCTISCPQAGQRFNYGTATMPMYSDAVVCADSESTPTLPDLSPIADLTTVECV